MVKLRENGRIIVRRWLNGGNSWMGKFCWWWVKNYVRTGEKEKVWSSLSVAMKSVGTPFHFKGCSRRWKLWVYNVGQLSSFRYYRGIGDHHALSWNQVYNGEKNGIYADIGGNIGGHIFWEMTKSVVEECVVSSCFSLQKYGLQVYLSDQN